MQAVQGMARWVCGRVIAVLAVTLLAAPMPARAASGGVDPSSLPPQPLPIWPAEVLARHRAKGAVASQTFVDSQGRSLMYRYSLPAGASGAVPQGVMIYFHGNNTGTQDEILAAFFPGIEAAAHARGLAAVAVASPDTRDPPQETMRQWYDEDWLTIQEFMSTRLPTHFAVDTQRVMFMGGSQGTCFLNDFLQVYGESYGGGFFGGCGCYNRLDEFWTPSESFRQQMKVYISSSSGDFLHEYSWRGYGYWKHTLGLDTRGELDVPGAHCSTHWSALDTALDWFVGDTVLPEEPFRPHFSRVSALPATGLALTSDGVVWQTTRRAGGVGEPAEVHELRRSGDEGESWAVVREFEGAVSGLASDGTALFVLIGGAVLRSDDGGENFAPLPLAVWVQYLFSDGRGAIGTVANGQVQTSANAGEDWDVISASPDILGLVNEDVTAAVTGARMTIRNYNSDALLTADWPAGVLLPVANTAEGQPNYATWDGARLWAMTATGGTRPRLYQSSDPAAGWNAVVLPEVAETSYYGLEMRVSALPQGVMLVHGAGFSGMAWQSSDNGATWVRVPGLESAFVGGVVADTQRVFFTNGSDYPGPVFRMGGEAVGVLFADGFE